MARPKYVNSGGSEPSIETWQEACVISQEWADGARLAVVKRRHRQALISLAILTAITIAAALTLALLITGVRL